MTDIVQPLRYKIDVRSVLQETPLHGVLMRGDKNANRIIVELVDGEKPVPLDGVTVTGKFFRGGDAVEIALTGSAKGNLAEVKLNAHCYAVEGNFRASVRLGDGEARRTILTLYGRVIHDGEGGILDVEHVIPSVDDIVAQYQRMQEVTQQTENAGNAATDAASAATGAAESATAAAQSATAAASAANTATNAANAAAARLDGMTATAEGLPAGSAPTVSVTTGEDGAKRLAFGIPKGEKGETGATPQLTVNVTTGEPGTEASVVQSGTAEMPVLDLTIPRGNTGDIGALKINGKAPDASGAVTLEMGDIDGLNDAIAGAGKVKTVAGVAPGEDGNVALDAGKIGYGDSDVGAALSQLKDDKLGKTETAADSAKLGGKAPEYYIQPRNLLDNSDFRNPVNQREKTSYSGIWVYSIDRWVAWLDATSAATVSVVDGGITPFPGMIIQRLESKYIDSNKTYTLAAMTGDGLLVLSGKITSTTQSSTNVNNGIHFDFNEDSDTYQFTLSATTSASKFVWAALYEGSYTADTLPPYVAKGYAAELAECMRYYQTSVNGYNINAITTSSAATNSCAGVLFPVEMCMKPTVKVYSVVSPNNEGYVYDATSGTDIQITVIGANKKGIMYLAGNWGEFTVGHVCQYAYIATADF